MICDSTTVTCEKLHCNQIVLILIEVDAYLQHLETSMRELFCENN